MSIGNFLDSVVMFAPEGAPCPNPCKAPITTRTVPGMTLYLYCHDVDHQYKRAMDHGAISRTAPMDGFWGDRFCEVTDIDGYRWTFATHLQTP